jgi:SAM-dependent methyltransferase
MRNLSNWQPSKISYDKSTGQAKPLYVPSGSRFITSLQAPIYVKTIKKYARGCFLDCGAGVMPYYAVYKDLVAEIHAIDWGNSLHNKEFLDKSVDLNKEIPYPKNKFDSVLLADVLEHIHNPSGLMSELSRVLKAQGMLICFVPFMYWVHEDPHDYHRYTRFMLEKMCTDNELSIIELKPYGGGPDVLIDSLNKLCAKSRILSKPIYYLSIILSKLWFYRKAKQRMQQKMPLGYVLVAKKG